MFSDLIFAFSGFGLLIFGMLIGWWLKPVPEMPESSDTLEDHLQRQKSLSETASKIQLLTQEVARNVGEHNSRVEEINNELSETDSEDHDSVVRIIERLVNENHEMQDRLNTADSKLQLQAEELASQTEAARTDALTGLPNRRAFDEEIERMACEFKQGGPPFSVVMVDVDRFKVFNDTYGHQTGDRVLEMLGDVLRSSARDTDIPVRFGGEEFTVILPDTEIAPASFVADRIRQNLEKSEITVDGQALSVTASFGVAESLQGESPASILRRSDEALYESKEQGRNRVHWHDGGAIRPYQPVKETETLPTEETLEVVETEENQSPSDTQKTADEPSANLQDPADLNDQPVHIRERAAFLEVLSCRIGEWRRNGPVPSVLMLKIDNLPAIKLLHGSMAVNIALQATRKFLQAATRDMDFAAQYDVGEFGIIFPGAGKKNMIDVAMRIKEAISRCRIPIGEDIMNFTVSEGVAEAFGDDTSEDLIRRAHKAMNAAAKAGGDYCYFHNGQTAETIKPPMTI